MYQQQIIQAAVTHFNTYTGFTMTESMNSFKYANNRQIDTEVEITAINDKYTFWVEVKNEIRQIHIPSIINQFGPNWNKWLLICQYISKENRLLLKKEGVNYLDASGNCYIRQGNLLLFINDIKTAPQRQSNSGKLWQPSGMRLIFSLLLNPELINESYRTIAHQSKLALGNIGAILNELVIDKYYVQYNNTFRIEDRKGLLNRWIENYSVILRPKLVQGKFRFATPNDRNNWQKIKLKNILWGAEPAAALLTNYLHPEKFVVYSELPVIEIMKQMHIVPDKNGEVEVLSTFWNVEENNLNTKSTVPPLLIYAELNVSYDSRNRETAERIKKQYNV